MDLFQNHSDSWHDFSLDKIFIDYDNISVHLEDGKIIIKCCEYIYFSSFAHWDENILKAIQIDDTAPIINKTLQAIQKSSGANHLGGGTKSLSDKYYYIGFEFLDGNIFEVVCKNHIILTD